MLYNPNDHLEDIRLRLQRDDNIEVQIRAVEEAAQFPEFFAEDIIRVFERNATTRYLVFERLIRFGAFVTEALKRVFSETSEDEVKTLAGLLLVHLDSPMGVAWLSEALLRDREYTCLIASALMKAGVEDVEQIILRRLEQLHSDEPYIVVCLLDDLRELGYPHLSHLYHRVLAEPALEKIHLDIRMRQRS